MPEDLGLRNVYIMYGDSIANYFNRRILFYGSLEDYLTAAGQHYELNEGVNFNPADGINTYLDVVTDDGDKYTYLLVTDEDGEILSRWFILEADRNMGGQYRFKLKRDVVAESLLKPKFVTQAPIYVEKGILKDDDPMIVNKEGLSYNQIKKSEKLIAPAGFLEWGWIVGYFEKGTSASFNVSWNETVIKEIVTASSISSATGIPLTKINNLLDGSSVAFAKGNPSLVFGIETDRFPVLYNRCVLQFDNSPLNKITAFGYNEAFSWEKPIGKILFADSTTMRLALTRGQTYIESQTSSAMKSAFDDVINNDNPQDEYLSQVELEKLKGFRGSRIVKDGITYIIDEISTSGTSNHPEVNIVKGENSIFDNIAQNIINGTTYDDWIMFLNYKIENISISLKIDDSSTATYKINIPASARPLKDAPYSMFVIPYGNDVYFPLGGYKSFPKEDALRIANQIVTELGSHLYDIQLLPYFDIGEYGGVRSRYESSTWITYINLGDYISDYTDEIGTSPEDITFSYMKDGSDNNVAAIFFPEVSNFKQTIKTNMLVTPSLEAEDEPKIESECNFYRLCSPNYDGVFEFNLAKNGMSVENFLVDCTYKPINPLIRIQPNFKGLYGESFTDGRGLICGGDFSLPIISDAWITYQQNNKNFATSFARDVQNLDVNLTQERIKETVSAATGVVGGTAAGAAAGAQVGGPYGAIAGAVVGLGAGAAGAAIDTQLGSIRRAEQKDYLIDRFNMNLENIKAIPQTLARNSSFTVINKIFPFLEYYSCTDEEKEALRRKIAYDGMTVGRIDYINNFKSNDDSASKYLKGQLIRAEGIEEDTHYVNALYEELAKGVYI